MWFEYQKQKPKQNKALWYFCEDVGVHKGHYYGNWEFASKSGFLMGDVTHWQYDVGQDKPEKPVSL